MAGKQGTNAGLLQWLLIAALIILVDQFTKILIVGTLSDYRVKPFSFVMTGAELAPESLPVAGGPCADPRPQMCTRDYRPACGLRRDRSSKTNGNACSACADPEVVSQAAGACPSP